MSATVVMEEAVHRMKALVASANRIVVISGAGMSTSSGIADYRGPGRPAYKPLNHNQFVSSERVQRYYWARSFLGFPHIAGAKPNPAHIAIARGEQQGKIYHVITQNVDSLHEKAGTENVLAIHGRLNKVICLDCGDISCRHHLQDQFARLNPNFPHAYMATTSDLVQPDGDYKITYEVTDHFNVVACQLCGGPLKPHVVLHGDNLPKDVTEKSYEIVDKGDFVFVIGSTLTSYSALRLVRRVPSQNVAVVNIGETRADKFVPPENRFHLSCVDLLPLVFPSQHSQHADAALPLSTENQFGSRTARFE